LRRYEAAKMLVEFANKVLCRQKIREYPEWFYSDITWVDPVLIDYVKDAYEMWILQWTKWKFRPLENISEKEFIAAIVRMITSENMDQVGQQNDRDRQYRATFTELWLDSQLKISGTIQRGDVARVFYKLFYNHSYVYGDNGYYMAVE
jgi:hypothetical protein